MPDDQSITFWLERLKTNDDSLAAQQLWQRFLERLIRVANRKLGQMPRRASDEEDVVLSAFTAFLDGVENHRFARLEDRDDLWQILVMLTERKAIGHVRREQAQKRGGGRVRGESGLGNAEKETKAEGLGQVPDPDPSPEFAAEICEQLDGLLDLLGDKQLSHIAVAKLEGFTNKEIAKQLDMGLRSVERKLEIIRHKWRQGGFG